VGFVGHGRTIGSVIERNKNYNAARRSEAVGAETVLTMLRKRAAKPFSLHGCCDFAREISTLHYARLAHRRNDREVRYPGSQISTTSGGSDGWRSNRSRAGGSWACTSASV
jgi:hypothetical protein